MRSGEKGVRGVEFERRLIRLALSAAPAEAAGALWKEEEDDEEDEEEEERGAAGLGG